MDAITVGYNDEMKKLFAASRQLNNNNKIKVLDTLSSDDALLVTGFKGTETNHQKCVLKLMVSMQCMRL